MFRFLKRRQAQSRIETLLRHDGLTYALATEGLFEVGPQRLTSREPAGSGTCLAAAVFGDALVVLRLEAGRGALLHAKKRASGPWRTIPLPDDAGPFKRAALTPGQKALHIRTADKVFRWDGRSGIEPAPAGPSEPSPLRKALAGDGLFGDHRAFADGFMYVGWDNGEWGGECRGLDLSEEPVRRFEIGPKMPVRGVVAGSDGTVWVGFGQGHGGLDKTALFRVRGREATAIIPAESEAEPGFALPEHSVIEGLAEDEEGVVWLLVQGYAGDRCELHLRGVGAERLSDPIEATPGRRGPYYPTCFLAGRAEFLIGTGFSGLIRVRRSKKGWKVKAVSAR